MSGPSQLLQRLFTHDVATGESRAYPDVRPLNLSLGPRAAFAAALAAARSMPGWTIVETDERRGSIRAVARTPRLGFADDVRVAVKPLDDGRSRIHVRSSSRIGLYDFGTNARRIRAFLDRVATRTGA